MMNIYLERSRRGWCYEIWQGGAIVAAGRRPLRWWAKRVARRAARDHADD